MRAAAILAAVPLVMLTLAGCYESPSVALHSPGQYLGAADSREIMHPTEEEREALRARFRAVQTDR